MQLNRAWKRRRVINLEMERGVLGAMQQSAGHTCSIGSKGSLQHLCSASPLRRAKHIKRGFTPCHASMGIGFQPESLPSSSPVQEKSQIVIPKSAYGLSTRQMAAMGITDPDVVQRIGPQDPVRSRVALFSNMRRGLSLHS